jgi:hypothetical protein
MKSKLFQDMLVARHGCSDCAIAVKKEAEIETCAPDQ